MPAWKWIDQALAATDSAQERLVDRRAFGKIMARATAGSLAAVFIGRPELAFARRRAECVVVNECAECFGAGGGDATCHQNFEDNCPGHGGHPNGHCWCEMDDFQTCVICDWNCQGEMCECLWWTEPENPESNPCDFGPD